MAESKKYHVEILAGLATFLTSVYIVAVNPAILSAAGPSFSSLVTATVCICFFSTVAMGLYARNPFLLAPGMGINAFFAYTMVLSDGIPYEVALGIVFWSGILFFVISIFKLRETLIRSIPPTLQKAISCGIGIFLAFIGLKNGGMIDKDPHTFVTLGKLTPSVLIFMAGFIITSFFILRRTVGAISLGIVLTTLLAIPIGRWWGSEPLVVYQGVVSNPDFSLFFKLDLWNSLKLATLPVLLSLTLTDLFESISTFIGVSQAGNLLDKKGQPLRVRESLLVDAFGTTISGLFGSSAATTYAESAVGVQQGGKTGLVAITAGVLFLPFLYLSPLLNTIPITATAPPLIFAGVAMMLPIRHIPWEKMDEAIPAFLAITLMPLTFSIADAIIYSFLSYTICKILKGKALEIPKAFALISLICFLLLFIRS